MNIQDCQNFSDVIRCRAQLNPEHVFIHDIKTERRCTFRRFDDLVEKTAHFLHSRGLQKKDIITAVISNSLEYCFLYFASIRLGAVFNPLPFSSHSEEILKNIQQVEPRLVVIEQKRESEFIEKQENFVFLPVGKSGGYEDRIREFSNSDCPEMQIDADAPACLYYSSGTTSDPKGVLFTHRNMIANIASICRGFHHEENKETHLCFLPLGHTASINYSLLPCAFSGGTIILAEDFWPIRNRIWQMVESYRVTYMETVPTVLYSLLNIYRERPRYDLSSIRFVGCGSAPLQKSVQVDFEKRFGLKVANLYGLSETGPTHIDYPLEKGWEPGSIGFPLDVNEVKIFEKEGTECEPGRTGEIAIKGANVFAGYFRNETLYKEVIRQGFFFTGDLGYRDSDGRFYFVDRKKDIIIKGGINIIPGEIDEILLRHPSVMEAVTVGVPDDLFGEQIHCYVVLKDGMPASPSELIRHCGRFLSKIKVPQEICIVDKIPKTHSGKLLRKKLRERNQKFVQE